MPAASFRPSDSSGHFFIFSGKCHRPVRSGETHVSTRANCALLCSFFHHVDLVKKLYTGDELVHTIEALAGRATR